MACYHPMAAVELGLLPSGKKNIKIIGDNRCVHDSEILERKYGPKAKLIYLPCGKCTGCRLDYSRMWADRCCLEAKKSKYNYFITLTYDNEVDINGVPHLPTNIKYDFEKNRVLEKVPTLQKSDLQKFFKDLRNAIIRELSTKNSENLLFCELFRYYACGEYGEKNFRPHYHIILFNCKYFNDMIPFYKDSAGYVHYKSEKLDKVWKKGLSEICDFSWHTAAYTARYVMKKHKGLDSDWYENHFMNPEFVLMSRRPGIGRSYYEENKDNIYKTDSIIINQGVNPVNVKPSRYYDKLYDIDNHERFEEIRKHRERKSLSAKSLLDTSLLPYEYLDTQEMVKESSIKNLLRKGV